MRKSIFAEALASVFLWAGADPERALRSGPESMKARILVTLKAGILDPQGKAIEAALRSLGLEAIDSVRQGKIFDVELALTDRAQAESLLRDACEKLLANQVVENFQVELL